MEVLEVRSGLRKPVVIRAVEEKDFKILTKRRYSFRWRALKGVAEIYKLHIEDEEDILGVMGLVDVPEELGGVPESQDDGRLPAGFPHS